MRALLQRTIDEAPITLARRVEEKTKSAARCMDNSACAIRTALKVYFNGELSCA